MNHKVITSSSASGLNKDVEKLIDMGWIPLGSHKVIEAHRQNRYSGSQHMDTIIEVEYSQTMVKK